MKKFILYTAVFGKMARFRIPELSISDVDKFCYTDLDIKSNFYRIKKLNLNHLIPVRRNRLVKICIPDEIFDNYEYSFYLDCNHPTAIDFDWLQSCFKPGSDFLVTRHQKRNCIYDEGIACIMKGKDSKEAITEQLDIYKKEGYPRNNGLYAAYWLFRHHTKRLKEFSKLWWEQVEKYSHRDQISLPYVARKYNMKITSHGRLGRK